MFDSKTFDEIPFPKDSMWTNNHICFINTTDVSEFHFEEPENEGGKICTIHAFDEFQGTDPRTEK